VIDACPYLSENRKGCLPKGTSKELFVQKKKNTGLKLLIQAAPKERDEKKIACRLKNVT
jgi:hypothetical protein